MRARYRCALVGYGVMPEQVHLLIGEPRMGTPSTVVHSLKLRVAKRLHRRRRRLSAQQEILPCRETEGGAAPVWQRRFYDFNVYRAKKRREKLEYMHRNPVTRRLVPGPKDWVWSSYAAYSGRGTPLIGIDFVD